MKKILCIVAMVGMSICLYGQKVPEEIDGKIKTKHQAIGKIFEFGDKKDISIISTDTKQFFIEDSLVSLFLVKPVNLKSVYSHLKNNKKDNKKDKEGVKIISVSNGATPVSIKRKDIADTIAEYYQSNCEFHTIVKQGDIISNAKFNVDLGWSAPKYKGKKQGQNVSPESNPKQAKKAKKQAEKAKEDRDAFYTKREVTLTDITVLPKDYTTNELAIAKEAIKEWYKELDKNLKEEYKNKAVLPLAAMSVKEGDIKLEWDKSSKKFVTSGVPQVKITVPYAVSTEDSMYYEPNPVAHQNLAPKFTISMVPDWTKKPTLKAKIDTVVYDEGTVIPPVKKIVNETQTLTEADRQQRQTAARKLTEDFRRELTRYAVRRSVSVKRKLENMFADKESGIVEVSHLINSREKINSRIAKQYFSRLKSIGMDVELLDDQVQYDSSVETVIFPFRQAYKGEGYSDYTTKELHLKYINGTYVIEKITVVPHSTKLKEVN